MAHICDNRDARGRPRTVTFRCSHGTYRMRNRVHLCESGTVRCVDCGNYIWIDAITGATGGGWTRPRCELIHDVVYTDASWAWADAHFDVAMDPDIQTEIVDECRSVTWQREAFHGARSANDFCFDVECDGWDRVNRWSERVQRDQTPFTYRAWWASDEPYS